MPLADARKAKAQLKKVWGAFRIQDGKARLRSMWVEWSGLKYPIVLNKWEVEQILQGHTGEVRFVAFSPDGKILASASKDKTVRLWNVATGKNNHTFRGHTDDVQTVAFSPDGKVLASASKDKTVWVWDVATGKHLHTLQGHTDDVRAIAFSPDSKVLASASKDKTVHLWDVATGKSLHTFQGEEKVLWVTFSLNGKNLVSLDSHKAYLWNIVPGTLTDSLTVTAKSPNNPKYRSSVDLVALGREGKILISTTWNKLSIVTVKPEARVFLDVLFTFSFSSPGIFTSLLSTALSPDGKTVAIGWGNNTVHVWDATTGKRTRILERHTDDVRAVTFSPDGKILASTGDDTVIRLWNPVTGQNTQTLRGHTRPVLSLAFSPYGNVIASGGKDKTVRLWRRVGSESPPEIEEAVVAVAPERPPTSSTPDEVSPSSPETTPSLTLAETPRKPKLVIDKNTLRLLDPNQNHYLDALEEGFLQITTRNEGDKVALNIELTISPPQIEGIQYDPRLHLGDISPGTERTVKIPFRAEEDVANGSHTLQIRIVESSGSPPVIETFVVESRELPKPQLRLASHFIRDQNNDEPIEVSEPVHITVRIQNTGAGPAEQIHISIVKETQNIVLQSESAVLDSIPAGETREFTFTATANPDSVEEEMRLGIVVRERYSKYGFEETITIPVVHPQTPLIKTYALLVGVDKYENFSDLVNPVRDVTAIEKELRETYRCETTILHNPTRSEFLTTLYRLADRKYSENDQLLVFLSGHGWFDERLKRGFLAMQDSKPFDKDPLWDSFVSHENVRTILERLDCRHVLLFVDSCFSGTLDPLLAFAPGTRTMADPYKLVPRAEYIQRKLAYRTRRYITAGGKEYVSDGRPGQHSPFARQCLEALRSYGGSDGILTFEEILLYLERVEPQPRTGELFGNEPGSSFVLIAHPLTESNLPETSFKFGEVIVRVTPADAEVTLQQLDVRPLKVEPVKSEKNRFRVPVGRYLIHASRHGYQTLTRLVEVGEGKQQTTTITLRPE